MSERRLSRTRYASYVVLLIVCVVLLYFFYARGMRFFLVPSESMEPTLFPNDYILTLSEPEYNRGDIVVAYDPIDPDNLSFIVKRVVAVGGDTVRIEGGALFVNGSYASEPYVNEPPHYDFPSDPRELEYTVPEGNVFLLGDNRNFSEDSSDDVWAVEGKHKSHAVPLDDIIGKVEQIYLPRSNAGPAHHYPLATIADIEPQEEEAPKAVVE